MADEAASAASQTPDSVTLAWERPRFRVRLRLDAQRFHTWEVARVQIPSRSARRVVVVLELLSILVVMDGLTRPK